MIEIPLATGADLDGIAALWGIRRRRYIFWPESDARLRRRIHVERLSCGPPFSFRNRAAGIGLWPWIVWRVNMWVN
jgi:hypothetical protein